MNRWIPLLALGAALLAVAPQAAARTAPTSSCARHDVRTLASAHALTTYDDDIEDAGEAPDFCGTEIITNDNRAVTVGIHVHNRSDFASGDSYTILLDTDQNVATGQPSTGADYELSLNGGAPQLYRWSMAAFEQVPASIPLTWIEDYGPAFELLRSDIGNPAGFAIVFLSTDGLSGDRAPDNGSWTYAVTPLTLRMRLLSHGVAHAGRPFTASTVVIRNDWDEPLNEGTIACAAKVGGRSLTGRGSFAHDRVTCTWRLPANISGKRLDGSVTASLQGARASRAFSVRVR